MATKDKAQKKAKLRHAEYYDFQSANINLLFLDPLQSIVAQQFYRISS